MEKIKWRSRATGLFCQKACQDHEKLFEAVVNLSQGSGSADFLREYRERARVDNKLKLNAAGLNDIGTKRMRNRDASREQVELELPSSEHITASKRIKDLIELLRDTEKPLSRNDVFSIFQNKEPRFSISMLNKMFSDLFKVLNGTKTEVKRESLGASRNIIYYKLDVKNPHSV